MLFLILLLCKFLKSIDIRIDYLHNIPQDFIQLEQNTTKNNLQSKDKDKNYVAEKCIEKAQGKHKELGFLSKNLLIPKEYEINMINNKAQRQNGKRFNKPFKKCMFAVKDYKPKLPTIFEEQSSTVDLILNKQKELTFEQKMKQTQTIETADVTKNQSKTSFHQTYMYNQTKNILQMIKIVFSDYKERMKYGKFTFFTFIDNKIIFVDRYTEKIKCFNFVEKDNEIDPFFTILKLKGNEQNLDDMYKCDESDSITKIPKLKDIENLVENNCNIVKNCIYDCFLQYINQTIKKTHNHESHTNRFTYKLYFADKVTYTQKDEVSEIEIKRSNMQHSYDIEFDCFCQVDAQDAVFIVHKSDLYEIKFSQRLKIDHIEKINEYVNEHIACDKILENTGIYKSMINKNHTNKYTLEHVSDILSNKYILVPLILLIFEKDNFYGYDSAQKINKLQQIEKIYHDKIITNLSLKSEFYLIVEQINFYLQQFFTKYIENKRNILQIQQNKIKTLLLSCINKFKQEKVIKNAFTEYVKNFKVLLKYVNKKKIIGKEEHKDFIRTFKLIHKKLKNFETFTEYEKNIVYNNTLNVITNNKKRIPHHMKKNENYTNKFISYFMSDISTDKSQDETNKAIKSNKKMILENLFTKLEDLLVKCNLIVDLHNIQDDNEKLYNQTITDLLYMFYKKLSVSKITKEDLKYDTKLALQIIVAKYLIDQKHWFESFKLFRLKNKIKTFHKNITKCEAMKNSIKFEYYDLETYFKNNYGDFIGLCMFKHYKSIIEENIK